MKRLERVLLLMLTTAMGCDTREPDAGPSSALTVSSVKDQEENQTATAPAEMNEDLPGKTFTSADLDRIESELKIKLPGDYRQYMLTRSKELRKYTYPLRGETEFWFETPLFGVDPDYLIEENLYQRDPENVVEDTFPGWWKEYFLIGSNGAVDYYGMRLEGTPGVWALACDGAKIKRYADSLEHFETMMLEDFEEELAVYKQLEKLYQQKVRGEVTEEEFDNRWQEIIDSN